MAEDAPVKYFMEEMGPIKITVSGPTLLEKGIVNKYYVYDVHCTPAPPGVELVQRRYDDFNWLRSVFKKTFPCVFIPPIPYKKVFGRLQEGTNSLEQRRVDFERFLNRIAEIPLLCNSAAFDAFLRIPHETLNAEKPVIETWSQTTSQQKLPELYRSLYPGAFDAKSVPENPREFFDELKLFLDAELKHFTALFASSDKLQAQEMEFFMQRKRHSELLNTLLESEKQYGQCSPPRLDVKDFYSRWAMRDESPNPFLYNTIRYEVQEIESMLEAVQTWQDIVKQTNSAVDKHTRLNAKTVKNDKQVLELDQSKLDEERMRGISEVCTHVLMFFTTQHAWDERITAYFADMKQFAIANAEMNKKQIELWEEALKTASEE